jgi:PAS domain S-box-containing protein
LNAGSSTRHALGEVVEAARANCGAQAAAVFLGEIESLPIAQTGEDAIDVDWRSLRASPEDPQHVSSLTADMLAGSVRIGAIVAVDHVDRVWSADDQDRLQRIANLAALIEISHARELAIESEAPALESLLGVAALDRRILEALSDGVVLQDADGRILDCNPSAGRILGLSQLELVGLTARDPSWRITTEAGERLASEDHPAMLAVRTGRPIERFVMCIETSNGPRWISVSAHPLFANGDGEPPSHAVTTFVDITDMKRAERRLGEQRVHDLMEALPIPIYTVNAEGFITYANDAAEAFWGPSSKGGRRRWGGSRRLYTLDGAPIPHKQSSMARCLAQSAPLRGEHAISEREDGRRVTFQSYPTPLFGVDGKLVGGVNILVDISDLKAAEERQGLLINELEAAQVELGKALEQAQAGSRAKSTFLANMSHELRTPLNGVIGLVDTISRTALEPRQHDMLRLVAESARALEVILSDILDASKIEADKLLLEPAPFQLGGLVRDACETVREGCARKHLALEVEISSDADHLFRGDAGRVRQILSNLLSNAMKFTEVGVIKVRLGVEASKPGGVPMVNIEVSDTGGGFDDETGARLFERFEQADTSITRRFGGTGLGLPIARDLAHLMGGDLTWTSHVGMGSRFLLTIPIPREVEKDEAVKACDDLETPGERLRILIAEDHPMNRKVLQMMLEPCDFALKFVENGEEAVQATQDERFDVVLMDMQMPVMDGLTAIREIRAREHRLNHGHMAIAVLSANVGPEHEKAATAAGADTHIGKPATLHGIFEGLERALAARAVAEALPVKGVFDGGSELVV